MSNYNTLKTADTINTVSIVDGAITTSKLGASVTTLIVAGGGPKVTAITYPGNDLAADPAGGQTIALTGTGFVTGCSVFVGTVQASVVTVVNATSVTFTAPALAAATYTLYLVNPDGGTATIVPGISYSGTPTWSTAAGTLGSIYEYAAISNTVAATGDGSISYSVFSGTLPTGSSLNTSTGVITGTSPASAGATTYTFVIRATDAQLQDSDRTFSITINTDVVTWSTPANNSTVTLGKDVASSTALSATSAAGNAITYTSTTLPAGLTISGATVTGTPTVLGTTATTFTATAATNNKTATAVINWTVSVAADLYFPYTTLLLSGAAATETFIADASTNNFPLTIVGDTKPNNFNPYTPGYYSNYFDGSGDYLDVPHSTNQWIGASIDFTIECWFNVTSSSGERVLIAKGYQGSPAYAEFGITINSSNILVGLASSSGGSWLATPTDTVAISSNIWNHVAMVRSGTTITLYRNGVVAATSTGVGAALYNHTGTIRIGQHTNGSNFAGHISNARVVIGTALYTSAFTPSSTPLTAIANTNLLTCQSNRFIDNSTNAFTITVAGNTTVNSFTPFVPNTAYAAYGSTYFDGTGDYAQIAHNSALDLGSGNFTVEFWLNVPVATGTNAVVGKKDSDSTNGWQIYRDSGQPTKLNSRLGLQNNFFTTSAIILNVWEHWALVRTGTTLYWFKNGVLDATGTNSVNIQDATAPLNIAFASTWAYTGNFNISDLRIVKGTAVYTDTFTPPTAPLTAITNTSLLTLQTNQPANNSMFLDSSTNAFAVTRTGNTTQGAFSPYGANWSNYFDGTGQSFYNSSFTGANFGTSNFTIEMWVLWSASAASNQTVIEFTGTRRIIIGRSSTGIRYFNDGTERGYTVTVPVGTWNHIAIVRVANTTNIYLNGVSGTSFADNVNWAETQFYVGRNSDGVELTSAMYLSNLRVVNGTAVYTSNFAIPTAPLTAVSGTTLLICKSNSFIDNSANAFGVTLIGTPSVQRFSPFSPQTQTAITHSGYFDGTTDYLATPSNAAFGFGTGDFTIECWIYPTGGGSRLLEFSSNTDNVDYSTSTGTIGYYNGSASVNSAGGLINANTWAHIAIVRLTGTVRVYVNGVLAVTQASTPNSSTRTLYIGGVTNGFYTGYISNARVVKGVAVYTANFTVPTAPLTATQSAGTNIAAITGTQTSLLTCQSPTFTDNSTNAFAITAFDGAKPRTLNPFGFTNASAAYSAATYSGSAYFDGTGDYLSAPANSAFQFTGDYTVEFWVNFSSVATEVDLVGNYASNVGTDWMILKTSNGTFQYYPSSAASFINGPTPVANRWYHVAIGRSGTSCKLYVDGISYGTPLTFSGTLGDASKSVYIGSRGGSANILTGYISNVRIVKGTAVYTSNFVPPTAPLTAITNTSLLLNMTTSGIYDAASMSNLETVADAKLVATHTPYAGSYYSNYFDGTGDWLTAPASSAWNFTGDWTWECWVYPTAFTGYHTFLGQWQSGNLVFIWKMNSSGRMYLENLSTAITATTTTIVANQWQHIALTRSSNTIRMFVNGVMDATTATRSGTYYSTAAMYVGASGAGEPFTGYISNMRVVNGTALYTGTFTPPTAPLTAIANTSLLTCQSNRFLDNSTYAFTITKNGDTSVQSFNPFQRNSAATMYFDGTGDWLFGSPLVQNQLTGNFTIECWAYPTTLGSQMGIVTITATSASGTNGLAIYFDTSNKISFWVNGNGGAVVTTTAYTANQWYHIALVRNGTTNTLYVNGVSSASNSVTPTWPTTPAIGIGRIYNDNSSYSMTGYINDLRITKGIARYTATFTPPTTAFITK